MNANQLSSSDTNYAIFLWLCGLFFMIWWTPIISFSLNDFITTDMIAQLWCGLVALLSFQLGLSVCDDVAENLWNEIVNTCVEFYNLMHSISGSITVIIFTILPVIGLTLGTWYFYFRIFGNEIFYDPVGYMILLPAVHWLGPLYLGMVLRKQSWLSWLSFR